MPGKKKPETLEELYAEKERPEEELRKAMQKEKILNHRLGKRTRKIFRFRCIQHIGIRNASTICLQ